MRYVVPRWKHPSDAKLSRSMSGFIKNALDDAEDLRDNPRANFEGRAVGCIACADSP
jgi:hypothetical protein